MGIRTRRSVHLLTSLRRVVGGLFLAALLGVTSVQAQDPALRNLAASDYRVVAVRVEFQPDTTRFTTGDGTFGGALFDETLLPNVDPLPHDAAYFQAHLDFLEHYVETVSDDQTQISTYLVPEVIRVSQPMAAYSPTGPEATSAEEQAKLFALVGEVWETADALSGFDFSGFDPTRTAFVLFHAGVGRDVELIGTTLDKTPQDLPSLTLDTERFAEFVGTASFNGFPVTNTLIIPRTESRQGFNFVTDEPFLLELSINGLLAASFFNYLGVPDLFNTDTGETAIGPFGLMDPNGIFAYRGLLPPEPTAWTRYYLGWEDPLVVSPGDMETVTLNAAALSEGNSIARVPISSAEYFLVENRNRDPEGDGLVLRVWQNGQIVEQRVQNGDDEFDGTFSIEGFIGGVVVGADTYDWALPGGLLREGNGDPVIDENGNTVPLNGGILIWHIDERRIRNERFNVDPNNRAIALEEADSAVDLGFDAPDAFANGSPFDFWYEGNSITVITAAEREVRLYENRFGPDTFPNSNTNEGGASFVTLQDFSPTAPQMTFVAARTEGESTAPLWETRLSSPVEAAFSSGSGLTIEEPNATVIPYANQTGRVFEATATQAQFIIDTEVMPAALPGATASFLVKEGETYLLAGERFLEQGQFSFVTNALPNALSSLTPTGPMVVTGTAENAARHLLFEDAGRAVLVEFDAQGTATLTDLDGIGRGVALASLPTGAIAAVGNDGVWVEGQGRQWSFSSAVNSNMGQPAFGTDPSGSIGVISVNDELMWLHADGSTSMVNVEGYAPDAELNTYPVLADLDGDERLDVVTTYGNSLLAFSQGGALVPGFPVELAAPAVAQPLVANLTDSGNWSLVIASTNGNVYAYDMGRGGRQVPGFPLAVGSRIEATPLLHNQNLYAVSLEGTLKVWRLENLGDIWWGQLYANAQNTSYVELDLGPEPTPNETGRLIVAAETYNWPNPVQNGQTYLRCMTTKRSTVRVTIIDAAGTLIDKMELTVPAGAPAEHLWQTDAPSGLYFARLEATADDGTTDTELVKLAIIR